MNEKTQELIRKDSFASLFMVFTTAISLTLISKNLWIVFWAVLVASITQITGDALSDAFAKNTWNGKAFVKTLELESLPDLFIPLAVMVFLMISRIKSTDNVLHVFDRRKVGLYVLVTCVTVAVHLGFVAYIASKPNEDHSAKQECLYGGIRLGVILGAGLVVALILFGLEVLREKLDRKDHRAINKH